MILFRVDGNKHVGSGHVMRCLAIAQKARENRIDCKFCVADSCFQQYIENKGFSCYCLDSVYDNMIDELGKFRELISFLTPKVIVVDSYFVNYGYLLQLKKYAKVVYIDDLAERGYPVDVLVNYNIYAKQDIYDRLYESIPEKPKFLLGINFVPLRKEFEERSDKIIVPTVKDVFVSTGGADKEHVALKIVQYLRNCSNLDKKFHFIIGAMNEDFEKIKEIADDEASIVLHCNVKNMCSLMRGCDVAISASGSTLYELCACTVPTICYAVADNQLQGNEAFCNCGLMLSVGDIRKKSNFVEDLLTLFNQLCMDQSLREHMAGRMDDLIIGKGTQRIVENLWEL